MYFLTKSYKIRKNFSQNNILNTYMYRRQEVLNEE